MLLKFWFPCIFLQRCKFHDHLKGSLHFCSVLLFSHIPLPFGPGSIWVGWMRRGRVAVRVARGHLSSCVNGQFWDGIQDQHSSTVGPFLLPVAAALWSFRKSKLNLKGSGELLLMNHKTQWSGEKAVSDAVITLLCAHWYQLDYGVDQAGDPHGCRGSWIVAPAAAGARKPVISPGEAESSFLCFLFSPAVPSLWPPQVL